MSSLTGDSAAATIRAFWEAIGARDFRAAAQLLAEDYVCDWPQSGERTRGPENFYQINAAYPGEWTAAIDRILVDGDQAASEVRLRDQTGTEQRVVSFFRLRDGKIVNEIDYWPDPFPAADWRAAWVERIGEADAALPATGE